jgi:N-formylglutamate deformylase
VRGRRPEIVLGDRFGAAAADWEMARAQAAFEAEGFVVARNAPFAGGFITQRYGRPSQNRHAIQIEVDRSLYLDERRIEPTAAFATLAGVLARVVARLAGPAEAGESSTPLAAE